MSINAATFKSIDPLSYQLKFIEANTRSDGRDFASLRPMQVELGVIETCLGSSSVRLGNTLVIAAVTGGIFLSPISEKSGKINFVCDYSLCALGERRQTQIAGSAISDKIQRIFDENNFFDIDQLKALDSENRVLEKTVWDLTVNLLVLCNDGAVVDCALMAATTALASTRIPHVQKDSLKCTVPETNFGLVLSDTVPIGFTFCLARENQWLIDPTKDEESVLARLTVCVAKEAGEICAVFGLEGPGEPSFSFSDLLDGPLTKMLEDAVPSRLACFQQAVASI